MEGFFIPISIPNPTLQTFVLTFLFVYLLAFFLLFRDWGPKGRPFASSCFTSLAHGTPATLLALRAILPHPPRSFSSPNTAAQNTAIDFSSAYFLIDLIHYLLFFPHDSLFILHHLVTLFVLFSCRYLVIHGAYPILTLLVLAEITSPCQNTWSIARARKHVSSSAAAYYRFMSPRFYALYSLVRGLLAPAFVFDLAASYAAGSADGSIPRWLWVSWVVIMASGIFVSVLWVFNNWKQWHKETSFLQKKPN